MKRLFLVLGLAAPLLMLSGCATVHSVSSDVSTYGEWPADRAAGRYAFERLPSQAAQPDWVEALEAAARPALLKAGFQPVNPGQEPDVLVQVGARSSRSEAHPWADPIWWRGGYGSYRYGPWSGPRWGLTLHLDASQRYEREVAVLIRDRATGKPLFEARASNEGHSALASTTTLGALFQAALMDFPRTGVNPRRVVVTPSVP